MGLNLVTAAASYPVTLAEAKAQCRIDSDDENAMIDGLIAAATDYVERYIGRAIITQTWRLTLDEFSDAIMLPNGYVQSVTSVQYYDTSGVLQTVSSADYTLDNASDPAWLVRNADAAWPALMDTVNAVIITYVLGYTAVPAAIKQAILLLIGQWFDQRADATEKPLIAMPNAVEALLTNHRIYSF